MAVLIKDIPTKDWQIDVNNPGEIISLEADILECIKNIIFTRLGDLPLNPYFGTNILEYVDSPMTKIIPGVISECTNAIKNFEPRVNLETISAAYDSSGNVEFTIQMSIVSTANGIEYKFGLGQLKRIL